MAIALFLGMTESGKSYRANEIRKTKKRSIVFDYADCFNDKDGTVIRDISKGSLIEIFMQYQSASSFRLIFKIPRGEDASRSFDNICKTAMYLGRRLGKNAPPEERILFVIDEADRICSSSFQPDCLKELVNYGRHDNVDTLAIARTPQRLHTDLRINASLVISFNLKIESSLKFLSDMMGREAAEAIKNLKKYHYVKWTDNGDWFVFDDKAKQIKNNSCKQ